MYGSFFINSHIVNCILIFLRLMVLCLGIGIHIFNYLGFQNSFHLQRYVDPCLYVWILSMKQQITNEISNWTQWKQKISRNMGQDFFFFYSLWRINYLHIFNYLLILEPLDICSLLYLLWQLLCTCRYVWPSYRPLLEASSKD